MEDPGSRNGTKVNGESITKSVLKPGDCLQVAHFEFRVVKINGEWGGTQENPELLDRP